MIRIILIATLVLILNLPGYGQNPVQWNFSLKKIEDKTFEIHLTASVQSPWHIYSQFTPEGGPVATSIQFNKNPLVSIEGEAKEIGKLQQKYEDVFGIDVKYFDGKVDFIQTIKVKVKAKTNISGTIEYMVCNDRECLPPKTVAFNLKIP